MVTLAANASTSDVAIDEMLRIAVAHQRDAILITEARRVPGGRRILYVNPAFTVMTGYTAEEAVGRTPDLTVGPETDREAIAAIQTAITSARPVRQEILKYRKDGSTLWVEIDIAPVLDRQGEPVYFVSVMRDVSEKRAQADLLERQAEALRQALAAKSLFLANVSHELRTPLNAILGYTTNLEGGIYGELGPEQQRSVGRVVANGQHLLKLIDDLLDLTRLDSGKMPVQISTFDLNELVAEVLGGLEPLVARSALNVSTDVPRGGLVVASDRHKVKQIVLNLVSNALKYTREGWVRVRLRARRGAAYLVVADSGVGIAPELHQRVFDEFWQVSQTASAGMRGSGLGLAICRRLAATLGGELTLESEPGKGSTFQLRIPLAPAEPRRPRVSGVRQRAVRVAR